MLLEEIKNIKSTKKDLRDFGLVVGIFFVILGALFWWKGKPFYPYFLEIGTFLIFFGLAFPVVLKPIQKVWMTVALLIGSVMTRVILLVLFYLVITPIGIISRLFGNKFLDLKIDKSANSYWIKRPQESYDKERYEKQY